MMDLIMIGILLGSFGLIKLFADFCESQIEPKRMKRIERGKRHVTNYSYTGNFSDTCHSNGKIYVPHCHISKNICR